MTSYRGQEDLDPLIGVLLRSNNLESTGEPELDALLLEEAGVLTIRQATGHIALRSTQLQELQHVG